MAKAAEEEITAGDDSHVAGKRRTVSLLLGEIDVPPPVFFCSVEPATAAVQKGNASNNVMTYLFPSSSSSPSYGSSSSSSPIHALILADLAHALSCLAREDPSLHVSVNQDSGQTVLSGMGELHLEIIHDRLRRDFNVDCSLGKLQVSYKECPTKDITKEGIWLLRCVCIVIVKCHAVVSLDRTLGSKRHSVSMTLRLGRRIDTASSSNFRPDVYLDLNNHQDETLLHGGHDEADLTQAIRDGVEGACLQGNHPPRHRT